MEMGDRVWPVDRRLKQGAPGGKERAESEETKLRGWAGDAIEVGGHCHGGDFAAVGRDLFSGGAIVGCAGNGSGSDFGMLALGVVKPGWLCRLAL